MKFFAEEIEYQALLKLSSVHQNGDRFAYYWKRHFVEDKLIYHLFMVILIKLHLRLSINDLRAT